MLDTICQCDKVGRRDVRGVRSSVFQIVVARLRHAICGLPASSAFASSVGEALVFFNLFMPSQLGEQVATCTSLHLRGRRCTAASNVSERPTTHLPQPLLPGGVRRYVPAWHCTDCDVALLKEQARGGVRQV